MTTILSAALSVFYVSVWLYHAEAEDPAGLPLSVAADWPTSTTMIIPELRP